jgi:hypothetical protein
MIEELIRTNKIKMDTINRVIEKTDPIDEPELLDKLEAINRFIKGFIDELKSLQYSENKIG